MVQQLHLNQFQSLFSGNHENYGIHKYNFNDKAGEKEEGKNQTVTNKLLTIENYKAHLNGEIGLGVIPIDKENKCGFSVIDVDVYGADLSMYVKAIYGNNLPMVPFRSKSGGLHLYIFYKQKVAAKSAIQLSGKFARLLGIDVLIKGASNRPLEIFPKQSKVGNGVTGSWINLPYYNALNGSRQCAIGKDGSNLSLDEALSVIKDKVTTLANAEEFINDLPFADGPPCLQTMYMLNAVKKNEGRNNYLFAFGTYLKKKDENFFEQTLYEVNQALDDPIDQKELELTILQSLRRKDYSYPCTKSPCVDFCRKGICKTRDFGVGKEDGYFSSLDYGQMYQIMTAQPYYEWEVKRQEDDEFKKLRFRTEDDVIRQDAFLKLCFRELHYLPVKMKQLEWFKLVNQYLIEISQVKVNADDDISEYALFKHLFYEFLLNRAPAQTKDQILNKRVYFERSKDVYMFRAQDLLEFLYLIKNFRAYSTTEIHGILRDMHATSSRIRTDTGKQFRVYNIPAADIDNSVQLEDSAKERFEPDFSENDEKDF